MSKFLEIENTLIKSYTNGGFPYPIKVANLPSNIDEEQLHTVVHHVQGETTPITLGEAGNDENLGFMQIDIKYPANKGNTIALQVADVIASAYPAGRSIAGVGVMVYIKRSTLSPRLIVGGFIQYSLTIYYYAQTSRN